MKNLSIDIETFSSVDLQKCGVYKYAESDDFEVLLFAYSVDGGETKVVDLKMGEQLPPEIVEALVNRNVNKWAFNAQFERVCISKMLGYPLGRYLDPYSWRCTMVWSAYVGLPLSLAGVGTALKLDEQKLTVGKDLIRYFCKPCRPTKVNGGRTRNLPLHSRSKWELFKTYNKRDVDVEKSIQHKLRNFPVPDFVWEEYIQDQIINDRGILIDEKMVDSAISLDTKVKKELTKTMKTITQLSNPNSVTQLKQWFESEGINIPGLDKKSVRTALNDATGVYQLVLKLRQQLSKSSVKKYTAMKNAICKDNRARGMFQFYGANRSGRWAGRLIQLQNLPQNHLDDLDGARELVKANSYEHINAKYDYIPDTLSQLIRTAFIPKDGCKFIVADFSAIEARVLSHMSGERWRSEVFEKGGDIYCASASKMFGVPVEKHGVNGHLRQKGKIAELALGYGGSVGALTAMGALDIGLKERELQPLVDAWREANPHIVEMWWSIDEAVKNCVVYRKPTSAFGVDMEYKKGMLLIHLPSGRCLSYAKPKLGTNKFGSPSVLYKGTGMNKKWKTIESYGPKFVENIIQGISRDILAFAIKNLSDYRIVAHVHDEVIIECPTDTDLEAVCAIMGKTPDWMPGLSLRADGYETMFYKKD